MSHGFPAVCLVILPNETKILPMQKNKKHLGGVMFFFCLCLDFVFFSAFFCVHAAETGSFESALTPVPGILVILSLISLVDGSGLTALSLGRGSGDVNGWV